jgi:hypothetical protein
MVGLLKKKNRGTVGLKSYDVSTRSVCINFKISFSTTPALE